MSSGVRERATRGAQSAHSSPSCEVLLRPTIACTSHPPHSLPFLSLTRMARSFSCCGSGTSTRALGNEPEEWSPFLCQRISSHHGRLHLQLNRTGTGGRWGARRGKFHSLLLLVLVAEVRAHRDVSVHRRRQAAPRVYWCARHHAARVAGVAIRSRKLARRESTRDSSCSSANRQREAAANLAPHERVAVPTMLRHLRGTTATELPLSGGPSLRLARRLRQAAPAAAAVAATIWNFHFHRRTKSNFQPRSLSHVLGRRARSHCHRCARAADTALQGCFWGAFGGDGTHNVER